MWKYIEEFETLATHVHEFSSRFILDTFIFRLKQEIKCEVLSYHPQNVVEAKNHALLHEENCIDLQKMLG